MNNFNNVSNNNNNNNYIIAEPEGNNNDLREQILDSIFLQNFATREELINDLNLNDLQQLQTAASSFFDSEPKPTLGERIAVVKIFLKLDPTERQEVGGLVSNYLGANSCIQTVIIALNEIRLVNNQAARRAIIQNASTINEIDLVKKCEALRNAKNDYVKNLTQILITKEKAPDDCPEPGLEKIVLEAISEPDKISSYIALGKPFFLNEAFAAKKEIKLTTKINLNL